MDILAKEGFSFWEGEAMPDESRYFAALEAAYAILEELEARPAMPLHERLAAVTFAVLRMLDRVEGLQGGRRRDANPDFDSG